MDIQFKREVKWTIYQSNSTKLVLVSLIFCSIVIWLAITICFLHLWLLPFELSRLRYSSKRINADTTSPNAVDAIDQNSNHQVCVKDGCNGHWKPPKTHHCSVCKVCRIGFDHHCHLVGSAYLSY
jgi:hypothetical protein